MSRIKPKVARIADWNHYEQTPHVGIIVEAVVIRHAGLGVLCEVGARRIPALLRSREISWIAAEQRPEALPVGTWFKAAVIGHDNDRRELLLSRKAADDSPFQSFATRHPVGTLVTATVSKIVTEYIVALEGGIEGIIQKETIGALARHHRNMSAPWDLRINDRVKAVVTELDFETRKVVLSVEAAYLLEERDIASKLEAYRGEARNILERARQRVVQDYSKPVASPFVGRLTVMIVENEPDIALGLRLQLEDLGHIVLTYGDIIGARNELLTTRPDVCILDLQLTGESGTSLIPDFHISIPEGRLFVFTGNSEKDPKLAAPWVRELKKPVDPDELAGWVEGRIGPPPQELSWPIDESPVDPSAELTQGAGLGATTRAAIGAFLKDMIEPFGGANAALLMWDRQRNKFVLLYDLGEARGPLLRIGRRLSNLMVASVLGDQLDESGAVGDFSNTNAPVLLLLNQLRCERMVGLPLEVEGRVNPIGVFLFLPERHADLAPDQFDVLRQQIARLTLAFERAKFDAAITRNQRALLSGSLVLGMTHEINNILQPIVSNVYNLIRWEGVQSGPPRHRENYRETLLSLETRVNQFRELCDRLLLSSRPTEAKSHRLVDSLLGAIEVCWSSAEQGDVMLLLRNPPLPLLSDVLYPISLQQVLVNLILNAIQHTKDLRRANALVVVDVKRGISGGRPVAEIRVSDNGSGIGGDEMERIFEMYVTTRKAGSGLGLYVTHLIVESLGGTVEVEESVKFFGTTMCVRLPLAN